MNGHAIFKFRLYVAGDAQNSVQARANLTELCETHLAKRYEIEVIDVLRSPQRALSDGIFMTPTLVRYAPKPIRRVVGTLRQTEIVLNALGLEAVRA